jgi:hypothetical protein
MKKQTALDWFIYQITQNNMLAIDAISLAKELEKQQIKDAYEQGEWNDGMNGDAEQYYNQIFNK